MKPSSKTRIKNLERALTEMREIASWGEHTTECNGAPVFRILMFLLEKGRLDVVVNAEALKNLRDAADKRLNRLILEFNKGGEDTVKAHYEKPTVPCKWCGVKTTYIGTSECDPCYNARRQVDSNPLAVFEMLKAKLLPNKEKTPT